MKSTIDHLEKEKMSIAEKYEILIAEANNLSARERCTIEKALNS